MFVAGILVVASSMSYEQQDLRGYLHMLPIAWLEKIVGDVTFTYSSGTVSIEEKGVAGFIEFFIRKGTHVLIYGFMTVCAYVALTPYRLKFHQKLALAFLFITLFAVVDEVRHFFHPDRTGLWQDVVLDMSGGALAVMVLIFYRHRRKTKGR
nr:VanZ family protein [Bacillus piscicola]